MKRFVLFAGDHYYPDGGWDDFVDSFDTADEAKAEVDANAALPAIRARTMDWWQIVDLTTGELVDEH